MYLEQDYIFHFSPFFGGEGGSKLAVAKRKWSGHLVPPPHSVRCSVQVQKQIAGGLHLILDHCSKVKTYLGKLNKFEVMISTKEN